MMPEQEALLRKAHDSLRASQLLSTEGFYDFAVSRAYYTMFYGAEALLLGRGLSFSKHSAVIAAFGKELVKTGEVPAEFHRTLIEAQEKRTIADYDSGQGITAEMATEQQEKAARFLSLAERLLQ